MATLARLPLVVLLLGIAALAMLLPAVHALMRDELPIARIFLWSAALFGTLFALIAIAISSRGIRRQARGNFIAMALAYLLLPVILAVPFYEAVGNTRFFNAWFEMVSSLTTTGATLFEPRRLPDSLHLWRATVGWLGGLLTWVAAAAILAPLNLGGFEVLTGAAPGEDAPALGHTRTLPDTERLLRVAGTLAPVYGGLTLALWFGLYWAGETPITAICHAMSTLATSGITTGRPLQGAPWSEAVIFVFLFLAVSRTTFSGEIGYGRLSRDPEIQMAAACILIVPAVLVLHHWIGAYEVAGSQNLVAVLASLWGAMFTTLSFLTTTGFESADWAGARDWSGLQTPGLILVGLALCGGGVATTAGGVKLMRIYALYKHGARELERLVHPSSVGGAGTQERRIRRQGALVAWVFFMLFAMSVALIMAALSLVGLDFEGATIFTISALSTTGPLAQVAADEPLVYAELGDAAKTVLALAMILGRLETLALIALLNPAFWRN